MVSKSSPPWWANSRGEWYVVTQLFLFALIALAPLLLRARVHLPDSLAAGVSVIGVVAMAVGGGAGMIGVLQLGDNLSVFPRPKADGELIENGMYAIVRHPIYSGLILSTVGWALFNLHLITLVLAVVLFVFFDAKSRREEIWLCEQFPAYAAYQKRVKKLIPFVY
ncbi:MAG: isoprenylcysteine carboxylmethyltransferase family protein [Chloroflexi bacterium]|nr:isoprenylcysteine carboxylmethyltransferase family protein [Chloroflexota bacterium]